ncbi:MAG: hypothetical protein RLZ44_1021 [Pseudomonadota bacterium]
MLSRTLAVLLGLSIAVPGLAALDTAEVEQVEVPRVYRLDGVVEAVNQSTVAAQTAGQVERLLVDVEDYVEQGALIAVLKDTEHQARLSQAEANLKAARAQWQDAQAEHERIKGVFEKNVVSKQDMDKAVAALQTARAQFEAAQATLAQAQEQYDYTQIRAPYTGIVTARHVEVGEIAQPGAPIMTGISLDQLRVIVDVPQGIVPAVRRYQQAQVRQPGDGWIDAAELTIFPFAEQGSNTFKVRLELPQGSSGMFPGMFVKTAFVTGTDQALAIPDESVVFRSEVTGVYVVDEQGGISLRHVRLGRALGDGRVAVLAGLSEGERVAVDTIAAGIALKAQRQDQGGDHE